MYFASLALGYVLAFTGATLSIGRSLSDSGTPTQDAITPPRFSTFAIAVYIICAGGLIYGFWRFGWLVGFGIIIGFFFAVALNKLLILPKSHSEHFRKIIIHSMIDRHADYLKAGDTLRASAMGMLIEKLGMPVNEFVNRLKKSGDA
jgi:hypothetical protein